MDAKNLEIPKGALSGLYTNGMRELSAYDIEKDAIRYVWSTRISDKIHHFEKFCDVPWSEKELWEVLYRKVAKKHFENVERDLKYTELYSEYIKKNPDAPEGYYEYLQKYEKSIDKKSE